MELKLIVLAGAKEGTQIPLKKDKFIIGRASECTLRAGSEAISRRHCAIVRTNNAWVVRDLGSRNGTFLNDQAVKSPTPLSVGDELRVGPLRFRVDGVLQPSSVAKKPAQPSEPQDINRAKQPPVKDVAEAAQRTASKGEGAASEDEITRWLLGIDGPTSDSGVTRETQTLSLEETTTIHRAGQNKPLAAKEGPSEDVASDEPHDDAASDKDKAAASESSADAGSSGWSLFKLGKGREKKKPGKLPPRPAEPTKDSREAAADILREMTRRR